MIRMMMTLAPYGDGRLGEYPVVAGSIWSTLGADGQPAHAYRLSVVNAAGLGHVVTGSVPKTASGHRNPLHILAVVAADLDLAALGTDYASTLLDLPADDPRRQQQDRRHRIDDLADTAIHAIQALVAAGDEGGEALQRIEAELAEAEASGVGPREAEDLVTDPDVIDMIANGYATGADIVGRR
ncbi:hypothetical protein [Azospirillum argentinense]